MENDQQSTPGNAESINLGEYWAIIVRRRRAIVASLVIAMVTAIIVTLVVTPVFTATTTVQIEPDDPSILGFDLIRVDRTDDDFYQTQYQLIQSRSLAQRVIEREGLAQQREAMGLYEEASTWSAFLGPAAVLLDRASLKIREVLGTAPPEVREVPDFEGFPSPEEYGDVADALLAHLDVVPIRRTRLVDISWSGRDPVVAATVANAIAATYIDMSLEAKYETAEQATQFLNTEIDRLQSEIDQLNAELQRFGSDTDVLSLSDRQIGVQRRLAELSSQYSAAQTERMLNQMSYERLIGPDPYMPLEVLTSALVSQLQTDYTALQQQYTEMSVRFKEEWPGMQRLRAQMEETERALDVERQRIVASLAENAKQQYEEALFREQNLQGLLDAQQLETMRLSRDLTAVGSKQLDLVNRRQLLDTLIERRNETGVSARLQGMQSSNIRVVDPALVPKSQAYPDVKLNLLVAVVLGLLVGVVIALVQDRLDDTLKTPEEVETQIRLPSLAVIPALAAVTNGKGRWGGSEYGYGYSRAYGDGYYTGTIDGDTEPALVTLDHPRSAMAEAYRSLRTSMLLSRAGQPPKTVLVTSCEPQEGKTTSAVNLAVSLAQAGKRVLLIDADMRRSRLHKLLQVDAAHGLAHFLTGASSFEESIQPTGADGLWLMPCGPHPPNPAELLTSERMQELMEKVVSSFDVTMFDTPPVMAAVDALVIAPSVDGILLVVKGGVTPAPLVERTCRKIESVRGRLLGVVLNNVMPNGGSGYASYRT